MDLISVCICTYKRPDLLARTLDGVIAQARDPSFAMEVVVVDNDSSRSAQGPVSRFQQSRICKISYDCEPVKNISLARNRAIRNASGNLIAFIDDDEFPADGWIRNMCRCLKRYEADGVLGPVVPHFPPGAPKWLAKSGICERPRNKTGSPTTLRDLRTGNLLLRRRLFGDDGRWFDPALGLTGGSDGMFLSELVDRGRIFVWCDEAVVYETVPEERWAAGFYLKRNLRIGALQGNVIRRTGNPVAVLFPTLSFAAHSVLLPFSALLGEHAWMKALTKISFSGGFLLAFFGLFRAPDRP
ncbi:MAG: glycosyltransferase [Candidatus Aminicenantes bacterium]|nr:glycosyltransferase [Candidatus Aminicenantes bacterium]